MYFIPRNNAFYNYIAHTSSRRRYIATLFIVGFFVVISFYGIYAPLSSHILLYQAECLRLQKQYEEMNQLGKTSQELIRLTESNKKNILEHAIENAARDEHCNKHMNYVLNAIAQSGLTLAMYGSCKEKDKGWYAKDSAHFEVIGELEKIIFFLKKIQDSGRMITFSDVVITQTKDNFFQLAGDVGIAIIKK